MSVCRNAVLQAGVLELGNFEFANGKRANNKLNFDQLFKSEHKEQLGIILRHIGHVAGRYEPELLIGVPRGGEKLAERLAEPKYLGLPVAYFDKDDNLPGFKTYAYQTQADNELVLNVNKLVIIEDVFNKFTSSLGALAVPGVVERTEAIIGAWDRGNHPSRDLLPVPHQAMVTEYIPNFLNEYDELFAHARLAEVTK